MPVAGVVKLVVRCSGLRQCHSYFTTVRIHIGELGEVGRFLGPVGVLNAGQVRVRLCGSDSGWTTKWRMATFWNARLREWKAGGIIKAVWLLPRDGGIGQHTAVARLVSGGTYICSGLLAYISHPEPSSASASSCSLAYRLSMASASLCGVLFV